ncbi:fatty acid--CoA ligase [Halomonas shantousis]
MTQRYERDFIPARQAHDMPLLIHRLLANSLHQADGRRIHHGEHDLSYADLNERVHRLGAALTARGVEAGERIAVLDWDSHRYLETFFGIPMLGAVLHTVNIRLAPEQIHYTLEHAEDSVVLVHRDFLPLIESLAPRLPRLRGIVILEDEAGELPETLGGVPVWAEYEQWLATAETGFTFPTFDEQQTATLFYTTGTTGKPKGVFFSHRQLVLHTLSEMGSLNLSGENLLSRRDVYMPITPMFHVHAWGLPYTATAMGLTQVYPGRYDPARLLALIQRHRVTFSHCVPTLLGMVLNTAEQAGARLDGWKVIIGGSALTAGLVRRAGALGADVRAAYGMSETCPLLTCVLLPPELQKDSAEADDLRIMTGRTVPLVELDIVDAEGQSQPRDGRTSGELVVRAPWLTQGYFGDPQAGEALWSGGWLHTGDVATLDGDGWLMIRDRLKDVIKSGGEWISSLALENRLSRHPQVTECAVIGIPDPKWGERPLAFVVAPQAGDDLDTELRALLEEGVAAGELPAWGLPDTIARVEQLPKTSVGKLDKKRLREQPSQS